jgi:hypothetical protein
MARNRRNLAHWLSPLSGCSCWPPRSPRPTNRALTISQLGGTAVRVVFAFCLAPVVFVAVHFYTLIRYDMLAGNVRRLNVDLATMVAIEEDRDRCRQLLANVEFVNALVMPKGSRASSWMFNWTGE